MFDRVTIIGMGLLGGSLAYDLRAHSLAKCIIGVSRSKSTADAALSAGIVNQMLPLTESVVDADLIVFATPMQAMVPVLVSLQDVIPSKAILTDVGSVKTDLYKQLKAQTPQFLQKFVLAHPIAGGENSGVAAAKLGLFKDKHVIITDTREVDKGANTLVRNMWESLGANVLNMSLQEHDAIFAKTSHLPHLIAFSLVNFLSHQNDRERLFDLAAAGFYDFTRIASSNAEMWRDICITNREEVLSALDGFKQQIESIRSQVDEADQEGILSYFGEAKGARDAELIRKAEKFKEQNG